MRGADIADRHRQAYATQRKSMRTWLPKWYWMFDPACINAFKIGVFAPGSHWGKTQQQDFRELLWQELFGFARAGIENKHTDMLAETRLEPSLEHSYTKLSEIKGLCAWCSHQSHLTRAKSRTPSPMKRCFGTEIDPNIPSGRAKRMLYGCSGCGVFLCGWKKHDCWYYWHGQQLPERSI